MRPTDCSAIYWMGRPSSEIANHFGGKAVAVIGASPGDFGTTLTQDARLPVLRTLDMRPAASVIDVEDGLTDETTREQLSAFLHGFVDFA